jgi:hypothetical protein
MKLRSRVGKKNGEKKGKSKLSRSRGDFNTRKHLMYSQIESQSKEVSGSAGGAQTYMDDVFPLGWRWWIV